MNLNRRNNRSSTKSSSIPDKIKILLTFVVFTGVIVYFGVRGLLGYAMPRATGKGLNYKPSISIENAKVDRQRDAFAALGEIPYSVDQILQLFIALAAIVLLIILVSYELPVEHKFSQLVAPWVIITICTLMLLGLLVTILAALIGFPYSNYQTNIEPMKYVWTLIIIFIIFVACGFFGFDTIPDNFFRRKKIFVEDYLSNKFSFLNRKRN